MAETGYLLDSNVFIEAANRYYAFDLVPGFWKALLHHADNGIISSIDHVKEELLRGKDDLADWVKNEFSSGFVSTGEPEVVASYKEIMTWVNSREINKQKKYKKEAIDQFADGADGWLVAYAHSKGHVLVTHESEARDSRRKVPIPSVCEAFKVSHINTFTMLRKLKVSL